MTAMRTPLRWPVAVRGGLEIEERAAAARAGDVVGLEDAHAGGLQNVVADAQRLAGRVFAVHNDGVANAIAQQRADVRRGDKQVLGEIRCLILDAGC
jgi:hypothetical protein